MILTSLKIKNFRSFGNEETNIDLSDISAFIGSNSSGKTAAIQAIQKMFGITQSERTLVKGDFHVSPFSQPNSLEEMNLSIEVKIEFPELTDSEQKLGKKSIPPFFLHFVIDEPNGNPHIRIRLEGKWTAGTTPEGEIEQKLYFITKAEGQEIGENNMSPVSPHQRSKIQMIYVPAIREPLTQLKNASGTILWRILNSISWPTDMDQQIKSEMKAVDTLFNGIDGIGDIKKIIKDQWGKYHSDIRYQDAHLEFNSTTLDSILKKLEIQFSPTQELNSYTIDKLGDGLRSLFYLSLVSSLLEIEQKVSKNTFAALTILAVEEPENHISPHLLGKVVENLNEIAKKDNAQVLLTSHSESIIKRISPEDICHLRIDKSLGYSVANRIILPSKESDAYKYIKEAVKAYPEIYFAKLVILGEGDTEEIVIPKFLKVNGIYSYDAGISIAPLGGRHVNHMWKLLNQLEIPHITLLDLDRERGGGGWGRIKYVLNKLIDNGHNREELLEYYQGNIPAILTSKELKEMEKWSLEEEALSSMDSWIEKLEEEKYNVFFSSPIDLDFVMLEQFPDAYKDTMVNGPQLPLESEEPEEYREKVNSCIQATLKSKKATGHTFTKDQHELMVWYNSLFLGRGKPSTHIDALTKISETELLKNSPEVFEKLIERIKLLIKM
ncbi:AAA family ATPase [Priestia aryabhattai]|uniref:ATP-dependent nuclease n=1 Tax=Priestia aryabhattai TaxID=412384 RepID=UPI001C8E2501|nr:AAA family ATPase [Priestia aryabhattai]MBX9971138.1 AAA family ATPase [Priestia aryabhattai]